MSYVGRKTHPHPLPYVLTSQAFIAALRKYPKQSYMQLLNTVRDEMQGKYTQKPQLSASHRKRSPRLL